MSAFERDFSDFLPGDSVYDLANGLIPDVAEDFGIDPGEEPTDEVLSALIGAIGANKVLRNNADVQAVSLDEAGKYLERSGVMKPLDRSLWTPDEPKVATNGTVITGAVANWQDRVFQMLAADAWTARSSQTIHIPIGNRVMDTGTETINRNVIAFFEKYGEYPKESQYAEEFIAPVLETAGKTVDLIPEDTKDNDEIAARFVAKRGELFVAGKTLTFARVANAGIQLAVQFRAAAQRAVPGYDTDPKNPQVYVLTDTFPIAATPEDVKKPAEFQSPFTGLRQVAMTAKMLHSANLR